MGKTILEAIGNPVLAVTHQSTLNSTKSFVNVVNKSQTYLAAQYGIKPDQYRPLNVSSIEALIQLAEKESNLTIVMRHGEQQTRGLAKDIKPDAKKIMMMQAEHNKEDGITSPSCVELFVNVMAIAYVAEKLGFKLKIESSANQRASQPAQTFKKIMPSAELTYLSRWDCVDYPDDAVMSKLKLMDYLDNGSLPWEKDSVDKVIGEGTFDTISNQTYEALGEKLSPKTLRLIITHTQQIQSICQALGLSEKRLANYGFAVVPEKQKAQLFQSGVMLNQAEVPLHKQSIFDAKRTEHKEEGQAQKRVLF